MKKIALLGVVVVAILAIAIGMGLFQKPTPEISPTKPEIPTEITPPTPEEPSKPEIPPEIPSSKPEATIKISQKDLREAYDNNPVAADQMYKHKLLVTVGIIAYIEEKEGKVEVGLISGSIKYTIKGPSIVCVFNDKREVIDLRKDEKIAVIGRNEGIEEVGWIKRIRLEDCHLMPFEEIKEFKPSFDRKTGNFTIQQFGCDLEVVLVSPDGVNKTIGSIVYFETAPVHLNVYQSAGKEEMGNVQWWKPKTGEHYLLVIESYQNKKQIIYEEKFKIERIEKAKLEILEIVGEWKKGSLWGEYEYELTNITFKFLNPEEVPLLIDLPFDIVIYREEKKIARFSSSVGLPSGEWELRKKPILLPGEERTVIITSWGGYSVPLTTDTKGGEYQLTVQLTVKTSSFEDKVLHEIKIVFKVPPYIP